MDLKDVHTAIAGADPVKGQSSDSPTETNKDANADSSPEVVVGKDGKPLPWDQQPKWKAARAAEKKLNDLLKANDLEDPDDLLDLVQRGKTVKGKLADLNALDEIIGKAQKLDSYENYWAQQAEKRRKEETDPETRAKQAEEQLDHERRRQAYDAQAKKQEHATKQAIKNYEDDVLTLIKEVQFPKEQESFVAEMFGVNNPSNDVNIMDKKAIKKLVADGLKRYDALKQSIISDYLKGKTDIVKTGKGSESSVQDTAPKISLKEARKMAGEQIKNLFHGG
jgi:hypothetical protein